MGFRWTHGTTGAKKIMVRKMVEKKCIVCSETFTTTSNVSTQLKNVCETCYSNRKQSRMIANYTKKLEASIVSLEDRVLQLENMLSTTVEVMIAWEVMNQITQLPNPILKIEEVKTELENNWMTLNTKVVEATGGTMLNITRHNRSKTK